MRSTSILVLGLVVLAAGCNGGGRKGSKNDKNSNGGATNPGAGTTIGTIPAGGGIVVGPVGSTTGGTHARVGDYGDPSGHEQERLELANRARRDPTAEGTRLGVDLSSYAARPPLTNNAFLAQAALTHTSDMAERKYYAHVDPDGIGPNGRILSTKFDLVSIYGTDPAANHSENIAAGTNALKTAKEVHKTFIVDAKSSPPKHRNILLGYSSWDKCREAGFSYNAGNSKKLGSAYDNYITDEVAYTNKNKPFVTGVVFADKDLSGEYDTGEGEAGVTVTLRSWDGQTFTTQTAGAGGFCFEVFDAGEYTVEVSGGSFGQATAVKVAVGNDNVKVDGVVGLGVVAR